MKAERNGEEDRGGVGGERKRGKEDAHTRNESTYQILDGGGLRSSCGPRAFPAAQHRASRTKTSWTEYTGKAWEAV